MKRPETDAEWLELAAAYDRELATARSESEWWEIFNRQSARERELDDGTRYDAFEVLDELDRALDERRADQVRAVGTSGAQPPAAGAERAPRPDGDHRP